MTHSWENAGLTDGQTDNVDFINPPKDKGPKNVNILV